MHQHCPALHPHPVMAPLEMLSVAVCKGADLNQQNQTELATPDRILEQTTESEPGPAAATPTDRHDPDRPSLRARPLPKCLPAPRTFLYFNPLMAISVGLAVGHP